MVYKVEPEIIKSVITGCIFVYQNFQNSYIRISLHTILFEVMCGERILDYIFMVSLFIETQDIQGNEFSFFAVFLNRGKKAKKRKKEDREERKK